MTDPFEVSNLIAREIQGTITPEEKLLLQEWIAGSNENRASYQKAIDADAQLEKLKVYHLFDKEKSRSILQKSLFKERVVRFEVRTYLRYAAALIPILLGLSVWYYLDYNKKNDLARLDQTIHPGSQKAMLVLSNGAKYDLTKSTEVLAEGNVAISNKQHTLEYSDSQTEEQTSKTSMPLIYNELLVPRGGEYHLTLADGTNVWLNSGSSLRFPVTFSDSTRNVYLSGEAYFEVAHNGKPFTVNAEQVNVRVLGTSFNVSAYSDDKAIKTTLAEGKVKVYSDKNPTSSRVLAPNDQAVFTRMDENIIVNMVNASLFTSWRQGKFEFNNEDLNVVMTRLSRWYDFQYAFENVEAQKFHFSGRIDKSEKVSEILNMLQLTTDVKFQLKENTITVL